MDVPLISSSEAKNAYFMNGDAVKLSMHDRKMFSGTSIVTIISENVVIPFHYILVLLA